MKKEFSIVKIYFLLVSLVGIAWFVIGYWIVAHTLLDKAIISDEEYVSWREYYYLDDCKIKKTEQELTQEEIDSCKNEQTQSIISRRHFNSKESTLAWILWWTIFLIVFLIHFPLFLKENKEK